MYISVFKALKNNAYIQEEKVAEPSFLRKSDSGW